MFQQAAAFALGIPEEPSGDGHFDQELRAFLLMVLASSHLEKNDTPAAIAALKEAAAAEYSVSSLFAAQLLGQLAGITNAPIDYRAAIELATGPFKAELWLHLGIALQSGSGENRAVLLEAVKCYQEASRTGISLEGQPELYALLQNNLALAYLSMPLTEASDQLRMAIAVQALREALKVYRREMHPQSWASAQLNLANSLQYIPSSHPEENLIQAVEIYEELLTVRNKAFDPSGYARLLSNQANALAHLGIFGPAMEKISEAYKLFHWHGEPELAASAMELVEKINERIEKNRAGGA